MSRITLLFSPRLLREQASLKFLATMPWQIAHTTISWDSSGQTAALISRGATITSSKIGAPILEIWQ